MNVYLADDELFMVALAEDEPDHNRRYWFFDNLTQALEYIRWWNDLDSEPETPLDPGPELAEILTLCHRLL